MSTRRSNGNGGKTKCESEAATPQVKHEEYLDVLAAIKHGLDKIRHVAAQPETRHNLFSRAVPTDEYLLQLSQAGVLKTFGMTETNCYHDDLNAEIICVHNGQPNQHDCRLQDCPYKSLMRMRLTTRLRAAYALERRRHAER